jgi:hypothetical protein
LHAIRIGGVFMKSILYLATAVSGVIVAGGAQAATAPGTGVVKTWVSTTGKDTGTCPISAPCQTFQ